MNSATTYNDATALYSGNDNGNTGAPAAAGVNTGNTGVPGKNPSSWDPLDDLLLRHLKEIKKMGWKEISQYFDNRTPNACQFRWRRLKSGNLKSNRTALVDVSVFPGKIEIKNANAGGAAANAAQRKRSGSVSPPRAYPNTNGAAAPAPAAYPNANAPYGCPQLPEGQVAGPGVPVPVALPVPMAMGMAPGIPVAMAQMPQPQPQPLPLPLPVALPVPQHTGGAGAIQLPLPVPQGGSAEHEHRENAGFVPKVFVKSRRSSSIVPAPQGQASQFGHPLSPQSSISSTVSSTVSEASLSTALNTTLPGSKSRKNSFTSWGWGATGTRRPSAAAAALALPLPLPHPHSSGPSRRSSMILQGSAPHAPTALSKERRESIILREYNERKNSLVAPHDAGTAPAAAAAPLFPNQYTFADAPAPGPAKLPAQLRSLSSLSAHSSASSGEVPAHAQPPVVPLSRGTAAAQWTAEEEQLLGDARARRMSAVELSLVLPARSKEEIEHKLRAMHSPGSGNSPGGRSPARSASLSPRKPLSVGQLAMQAAGQNDDDDDAVDPLHSHHGISRSSTASSSKDVSPGSFAADDTVSTTPSSATSVSTAGRGGEPPAAAAGSGGKHGAHGAHGLHGALLQSRTGSNGNPPLPSISSIFQNMV